jgi:ELWxxDGT repeat protein
MQNKVFEEAVALIKSGDMLHGQRMLWDYLQTDPKNENGWVWLAQTQPGDAQRLKIMLECLKHNPESLVAQMAVKQLRAHLEAAALIKDITPFSKYPAPAPQDYSPRGEAAAAEVPEIPFKPPEPVEQPAPSPVEEKPIPPEETPTHESTSPEAHFLQGTGAGKDLNDGAGHESRTGVGIDLHDGAGEELPPVKAPLRLSPWSCLAILVLLIFLGLVGFVFVSYYLYPSPTATVDLLALAATETFTPVPTTTVVVTATSTPLPSHTVTATALPPIPSSTVEIKPVIKMVRLSAPNASGTAGEMLQFTVLTGQLYSPDFNNISRYAPVSQKLVSAIENPQDLMAVWVVGSVSRLFFFTTPLNSLKADSSSLWVSDGTTAGTQKVLDGLQLDQKQSPPAAVGDNLYFVASQKNKSPTLWTSDGTAEGTLPIIPPGVTTPQIESIRNLTPLGDRLYFTAIGKAGQRLWVTDGTSEGTRQFDAPTGASISQISSLAVLQESMYISTIDIHKTPTLWKVDASNLTLVNAFAEQGKPLDITSLTASSGSLYVKVKRANQTELWVTDGTPAGSSLLHVFAPEAYSGHAPSTMVDANGTLYLVVADTSGVSSLWRSDGTPQGTLLVYAFAAQDSVYKPVDLYSLMPQPFLVAIDNMVYFLVQTAGKNNVSLWQSDGSEPGTLQIMASSSVQLNQAGLYRAGQSTLIFTDIDSSTYLYQP